MSSAITIVGQTRINELRGAEQPLIIDRMILALIPGLDDTAPVDRAQQIPTAEQIVHTAVIDADHKGYVNPDQVVYSIILGSDLGDFSFNWIGLIEETTDTVIAVTSTPDTPKRKTNIGTNTTGNNITRNFMIQFVDAQNLTAITVTAETWQYDVSFDMATVDDAINTHGQNIVDPSQEGSTGKHVTDSQSKKWEDHANDSHDYTPSSHPAGVVNPTVEGSAKLHVTNTQAKKWEDHANDPHDYSPSNHIHTDSGGAIDAWAQIDGTGTVNLRDSYGISGVVDAGNGKYKLIFSTPFPNNDYAVAAVGNRLGTSSIGCSVGVDEVKADSVIIECSYNDSSNVNMEDFDIVMVMIIGS